MKIIIQCVAGAVLIGLCTVQGPTPANVGPHGLVYLRALPAGAVHHLQAPRVHLRAIGERETTDLNWSGFAVETSLASPASNAVSDATGGWIVPATTGSSGYQYSSAWVGIDGYSTDTVEQIGTEQDWTPRGASYYAWFEMYPNGGYEIVGFPVHPGDMITAQVAYTGSSTETITGRGGFRGRPVTETVTVENFKLTLTNLTHTFSYSTTQSIEGAERASAEWVMEAPSSYSVLPLANFGTINFFGCDATINGVTGPIGDAVWQNDAMTMVTSGGVIKALPSPVPMPAGGTAFSVKWYHQ